MKRFSKMIFLLPLLLVSCQAVQNSVTGPGTSSSSDPAGSISSASAALTALKAGDVSTAQSKYDEALAADPSNTDAAFGAAFTRMMTFSESTPATNVLADFGQMPMKTSNFFGTSGYLSALKAYNDSNGSSSSSSAALVVNPKKSDYLPLAGAKSGAIFLSMARNGLQGSDLQKYISDMVPLIEDIESLLQQADQKDDFQYIIPKEFFYGEKDIPLNRIDVKNLRASYSYILGIMHLINSWDFPLTVSGIFDSNGVAINKQALLDQLNTFFTLKSTNEIVEAQGEFQKSLQLVLDGLDLQSTVTTDGVFEKDSNADAAYDELRTLSLAIQKSLAGSQQFPFSTPVINIDLNNFFTKPPDARSLNIDPFVLENGQIRFVESFFEQLLSQTIDLDFNIRYMQTFTALKGSVATIFFDEFVNFIVAGSSTDLGSGTNNTSSN